MNILLDTNALVWILSDAKGKSLGPRSKQLLNEAETVYASSVSVLEIRIKAMLGKLVAPTDLLARIDSAKIKSLPFSAEHAEALLSFPSLSKHDPFDRMLLAQAQTEGFGLISSDRFLVSLKFDFVFDARS